MMKLRTLTGGDVNYTLPPFPDYAAFFSWALGIRAVS
jgi:hypothetical protein